MKAPKKTSFAAALTVYLALAAIVFSTAAPAQAKSLFVVPHYQARNIDAWNINPDGTLTSQVSIPVIFPEDDRYPTGMALDEDSQTFLFTSEYLGGVGLFDFATGTTGGVYGLDAVSLAGVAVDGADNVVYAVKRNTNELYIYDLAGGVLSPRADNPKLLSNCVGAFGIALDDNSGILYVADTSVTVEGNNPAPESPVYNELDDAGNDTFTGREIHSSTGQVVVAGAIDADPDDVDFFEVTGLSASFVTIEVVEGDLNLFPRLGEFDAAGVLQSETTASPARLNIRPDSSGAIRFAITHLVDSGYTGLNGIPGSYSNYKIAVWDSGRVEGMVRAYETAELSDAGLGFQPSHRPVGIAVDTKRNCVYTVSVPNIGVDVPEGAGSNLLSKYDLNSATETIVDMGHPGIGVAVDELTGYAYITGAGDANNISVWDTETSPFTEVYDSGPYEIEPGGPTGHPAAICIPDKLGYNPLNLLKIAEPPNVAPGGQVTYTISIENPSAESVSNVTIVDNLAVELVFDWASDGGVYDSDTRTVTWTLGTIDPGQTKTVTLVATVKEDTPGGITIVNFATVDGTEIPPSTETDDTEVSSWTLPCEDAIPSVAELWPPNHKFVDVQILGLADPYGNPANIVITAITSDEATATEKGAGGDKHAPDAQGVGTSTAALRAERSGKGNGRVYEISFTASVLVDGVLDECEGSVKVCAPHDMRPGHECIDDGQNYDATTVN